MLTKTFPVSSHPELEVSVRCNVTIVSNDTKEVRVEATGSEELLEDVELYQEGDTIVVRQQSNGGSVTIGNIYQYNSGYGNQVIQTGGATYINTGGAVYINGKRVDIGGIDGKEYEPVFIKIYCPGTPSLNLDLSGCNQVKSQIDLADVSIDAQGSGVIELGTVDDLNVDVQGSTQVRVSDVQGTLNVDSQGSAQLNFWGNYENVTLDVQGSSRIHTRGTCRGNYKIDAQGSCRISHTGEIYGRVRKSTQGRCQIDVGA